MKAKKVLVFSFNPKGSFADAVAGQKDFSLNILNNGEEDKVINSISERAKKENVLPIFNLEINSGSDLEKDLKFVEKLKNAGIEVTATFNEFNAEKFQKDISFFDRFVEKLSRIFFAKESEMNEAVLGGFINPEGASSIEFLKEEDLKPREGFLNANIVLYGESSDKATLDRILKEKPIEKILNDVKDVLGAGEVKGGKVTIAAPKTEPENYEDIANLFATKFNIKEKDQIIGLELEIQDILKDQKNAPKLLDEYKNKLNAQFLKDKALTNQNIDLYFDKNSKDFGKIFEENQYIFSSERIKSGDLVRNRCEFFGKESLYALIKNEENKVQDTIIENYFTENKEIVQKYNDSIKKDLKEKFDEINTKENSVQMSEGKHLYENNEIEDYLRCSVGLASSVRVSSTGDNEIDPKSSFGNQLSEAKKDLDERGKKSVLMPINTGGHWVGLYVEKDEEGVYRARYNDPAGTDFNARENIVAEFNKIFPKTVVKDLAQRQQTNAYDCGVYSCDNLKKWAKGEGEILGLDDKDSSKGLGLRRAQTEKVASFRLAKKMAKGFVISDQNKSHLNLPMNKKLSKGQNLNI